MKSATTYEVSKKFRLDPGYLRKLIKRKNIKATKRSVGGIMLWFVDTSSLKKYLSKRLKPGRPAKK